MLLFGLVLVVGILVDESIVIIENIYCYLELGKFKVVVVWEVCWEIVFLKFFILLCVLVVFVLVFLMNGIFGVMFCFLVMVIGFLMIILFIFF